MSENIIDKSEADITIIIDILIRTVSNLNADEYMKAVELIEGYRKQLFEYKKALIEHLSEVKKEDKYYEKSFFNDMDGIKSNLQKSEIDVNKISVNRVILIIRQYYNKRIEFYRRKILEYEEKNREYESLE